jgi:preprotein translocase subunit SecB
MPDQDSANQGNGSGEAANEAQFSVLAQYIKDLSVENPSSPQVFQWQVQPTLDVQFNLNAEKVADDVHEVSIKIEVSARSENGVHFVVDLTYAGLFGVRNMPEEAMGPVLLVEAPRLIFPFARQIVSEAVTNTGFPPLMLDPIDFTAAYVAQLQAAQQQQQQGEGGAPGGDNEPEGGSKPEGGGEPEGDTNPAA